MKVCVKKIYCSNCQRLIKCKEQETGGTVRVTCPSCNKILYTWNGVSWRITRAQ